MTRISELTCSDVNAGSSFCFGFFLDADCDAGRQETIGMSFKKKEKKKKLIIAFVWGEKRSTFAIL